MLKYDKAMMSTAYIWAAQSHCVRHQVGCIISIDGRIISNGYNGTITGSDNCCEDVKKTFSHNACPTCNVKADEWEGIGTHCPVCRKSPVDFEDVMRWQVYDEELISKNTVVHAEANALMFAAKNGIPTDGCSLYITLSPCIECSKMIIQAGIKEVIYGEDYRINHGIEFLKENGIVVRKYSVS